MSSSDYGVKRDADLERLRFIEALGPNAWFEGKDVGVRRYLVAQFGAGVVADCPDVGNALYYYRGDGDWKDVFRSTKLDALRLGAKRIIHRGDWKGRLKRALKL
jgi:hypothetical protein